MDRVGRRGRVGQEGGMGAGREGGRRRAYQYIHIILFVICTNGGICFPIFLFIEGGKGKEFLRRERKSMQLTAFFSVGQRAWLRE